MRHLRTPLRRCSLATPLVALSLLAGCGDEPPAGAGPGGAGGATAEYPAPYDADGTYRGPPAPTPRPRSDILVVVMETWSPYTGIGAGDSPLGSGWGEKANFRSAVTPCPEVSAALASALTGRLPSRHGVSHRDPVPVLHPGYVTLPEILKAHGYATRAFVASERLARGTSLWQGCGLDERRVGLVEAPEALGRWIASLPPERPYFALVVADEGNPPFGAANHVPRAAQAPEPFPVRGGAREAAEAFLFSRARYAHLEALRRRQGGDAAVAELAREVKRFLWNPSDPTDPAYDAEALRRRIREAQDAAAPWVEGLACALDERVRAARERPPVAIWTSAAGGATGARGRVGTGRQLYDEQIRIDLHVERVEGLKSTDAPASLLDLLPTLLDVLGLPAPRGIDGVSLLAVARGEVAHAPVISEETQDGENTGDPDVRVNLVAARSARWKYVVRYDVRQGTVVEEAYGPDRDGRLDESANLADAQGSVSKVPFDPDMCAAVERVRDGLWGVQVAGSNAVAGGPYSMGARVTTNRPAPVCR